jgi:hypothetical protein
MGVSHPYDYDSKIEVGVNTTRRSISITVLIIGLVRFRLLVTKKNTIVRYCTSMIRNTGMGISMTYLKDKSLIFESCHFQSIHGGYSRT